MPTHELDLTPFGFTPTESLAYRALTQSGPLTGYALAQALSIARANAYQALRGLVTKGAVTLTAERPERYRPLQPAALFALLASRQAETLDRLEAQLVNVPSAGGPALLPLAGERAVMDLALRTAARATGPVTCAGPSRALTTLAPAWHKRAQERRETALWTLPEQPVPALPIPIAGAVKAAALQRAFNAPVLILVTPDAALACTYGPAGPTGYWTSDSTLRQVIAAAASLLTIDTSD
jgi:sugar-specific transcriptional regulator TrmB